MNATDPSSILQVAMSGRGLVEIVALATLLGSRTAGDLVLGNGGAAGLVWASISGFGCSSVIKTCAGAAAPGWLRQMLGIRTSLLDNTLGMDLPLGPEFKVARRMRTTLEDPLGVSCETYELGKPSATESGGRHPYRDVFAFDTTASVTLSGVSPTPQNTPLTVYAYLPYTHHRAHNLGFQVVVLLLSLVKVVEIYTLCLSQGGGILYGLLTGVPFVFTFLTAVLVEAHDFMESRRPVEVDGHLDILAASPLPTTKRPGGPKKVVLGASQNARTRWWWRFLWTLTGVWQTFALVTTYFLLNQQSTSFVLIWAAFQLIWSLLRMVIFRVDLTIASNPSALHPAAGRPMKESRLEDLLLDMKTRVSNLVLAVGSYQAHVHPRKLRAYLDDSFSGGQIANFLVSDNIKDLYTLPRSAGHAPQHSANSRTINVKILAVIGDTALSSAAWMLGNSKYDFTPMDLYDSCIVVFEVPAIPPHDPEKGVHDPQPKIIAIPSARVFSARSAADIEASKREAQGDAAEPLFVPRGTGAQDSAEEKEWLYWIPCDTGEWLQIRSPTANGKVGSMLGMQTAEVLDDEGVSRILGAGNLNISLGNAAEVRAIVDVSRSALGAVLAFLS